MLRTIAMRSNSSTKPSDLILQLYPREAYKIVVHFERIAEELRRNMPKYSSNV